MAIELINSLPSPINEGYVLCDSWYSCKNIFNASKKAGFKYVGGLRTNRVIYPTNHERLGIKLNAFGKTLTKEDVNLVKVGNSEYYAYSYKGKINDLKEALIKIIYFKIKINKSY